jgi:hypothetical protein
MCERKDATAGGVQRKGPGLHYKPFGASGRSITAFFLRNLRTVLAHFFQNLPSIESWVKLFPDEPIDRQEQGRHLFDPLHHLLPRNDRPEAFQEIPFG